MSEPTPASPPRPQTWFEIFYRCTRHGSSCGGHIAIKSYDDPVEARRMRARYLDVESWREENWTECEVGELEGAGIVESAGDQAAGLAMLRKAISGALFKAPGDAGE